MIMVSWMTPMSTFSLALIHLRSKTRCALRTVRRGRATWRWRRPPRPRTYRTRERCYHVPPEPAGGPPPPGLATSFLRPILAYLFTLSLEADRPSRLLFSVGCQGVRFTRVFQRFSP